MKKLKNSIKKLDKNQLESLIHFAVKELATKKDENIKGSAKNMKNDPLNPDTILLATDVNVFMDGVDHIVLGAKVGETYLETTELHPTFNVNWVHCERGIKNPDEFNEVCIELERIDNGEIVEYIISNRSDFDDMRELAYHDEMNVGFYTKHGVIESDDDYAEGDTWDDGGDV